MLVLPFPPSANRYWRHVGSRVLVSREAKVYRARVGQLCRGQKIKPLLGDVSVTVAFFRPRKAGDLDNSIKILLDSLRGFAFGDDSQVVELHAVRFDDKEHPRAEVLVSTWERGALTTVEAR